MSQLAPKQSQPQTKNCVTQGTDLNTVSADLLSRVLFKPHELLFRVAPSAQVRFITLELVTKRYFQGVFAVQWTGHMDVSMRCFNWCLLHTFRDNRGDNKAVMMTN